MKQDYCFLDFEYNQTANENVNLVCCSIELATTKVPENIRKRDFWLHNDDLAQIELKNLLQQLDDAGFIFVSYNVVAEGRCFYSLGLDPVKFKWIDLFLEYRCLLNHSHEFSYGKQLIDGKVKVIFPPKNKWEMTEEERMSSGKAGDGLSAACFKLLDVLIDTDHKESMRQLIISNPKEFSIGDKDEIIGYCRQDVNHLKDLLVAIWQEYKRRLPTHLRATLFEEMLYRAKYSAITAKMESFGYPIDYTKTKNFSDSVQLILNDISRFINSKFPEVSPFTWDKKTLSYKWNQKGTREWIENCQSQEIKEKWIRTDSGMYSLSLEAFTNFFDFRHDYPEDSLGAQFVRYLKTKQNLNGFMPAKKGKKNFWDNVGDDGRVRPYMNIFGAQSSRSQPYATGFLFLKSAWMRALCVPPKGKAISGIDFKSQEFLIAGLMANDTNMLDAYDSGDVYLYFGKLAGAIPKDGTKEQYKAMRDKFKSTVLGMQFGMGEMALANKLTVDTGIYHSVEDALTLIELFEQSFPKHMEWRQNTLDEYRSQGFLRLSDGWYMWGDNPNFRSTINMPIQGMGAAIMRKSVDFANDFGLKVIKTLHDAVYIEHDSEDFTAVDKLALAMDSGFRYYFSGDMKVRAKVGLDPKSWSQDYEDGKEIITPNKMKIKLQNIYVDDRGKREYDNFKKYFESDIGSDYL